MDIKFSKGDDGQGEAAQESPKKNQNALILLLVLLVGGLVYVYFFTGLLKPEEPPKPAAPAPVAKLPLPPRDGGATSAAVAEKKKEVAPSQPTAPAPAAPAAKAAPPPPAPAVKPAEPVKKAEPVKVADAKPAPAPVAEKKAPTPAAAKPAEKPAAPVAKKPENVPASVQKAATDTPSKAVQPAKKPAREETEKSGPWYVAVGSYTLEEELSVDMARVRKAGLEPQVKSGMRKKSSMNRLMLSESGDPAVAHATLDKLKKITSDAFIIDHGGKHTVYAGSYLRADRAKTEQARLAAAGFVVSLKPAEIAIPTQTLSVGPFPTKKGANSAASALRKSGLKATLTRK